MRRRIKTTAILSVVFILALASLALARSPISEPVLYFDPKETDQTDKDKVWRNAGKAGGELEHSDVKPALEEGIIEIPSIGFKEQAKWYTAKEANSTFSNAAQGEKTPVVNLENWTIGLLMRVNGPQFMEEHHFFGLQAAPREQVQNIRLWIDSAGNGDFQNLSVAQGAIGAREDWGKDRTKLSVGQKEWHWVHFVFESGKSLTCYLDGQQTAQIPTTLKFDKKHDMNLHAIFSVVP